MKIRDNWSEEELVMNDNEEFISIISDRVTLCMPAA